MKNSFGKLIGKIVTGLTVLFAPFMLSNTSMNSESSSDSSYDTQLVAEQASSTTSESILASTASITLGVGSSSQLPLKDAVELSNYTFKSTDISVVTVITATYSASVVGEAQGTAYVEIYSNDDLNNPVDEINIVVVASTWEKIGSFFELPSVVITIIILALTLFSRMIVKIFNMGVAFKSNYMTKKEGQDFENQMMTRMNDMESKIRDDVLKMCLVEIGRYQKNIDSIKQTADNMSSMQNVMDIKMKSLDDKYNDITSVVNEVKTMRQQIQSLQYGTSNDTIRRKGKLE